MNYYFDTNALLKYYDVNGNELGVENVRNLVESEKQVLISELTILETISVLKKKQRTNPNRKKYFRKTIDFILIDIKSKFINIPVPEKSFEEAQNILLTYGDFDVGSLDVLHAAIVNNLRDSVHFVTSDGSGGGRLIGVCKKLQISVYDPEKNAYI